MKKIIAIVGSGMVGRDPWEPNCWSRAGFNLFTEMKNQNILDHAIGVEVPIHLRAFPMLWNFSLNRREWSQKLNLDPVYYSMLTREIRLKDQSNRFGDDCAVLQIGQHYDGVKATGGRLPVYAFSDGNIAGMMQSPYFPKKLLPHAQRAFNFEREVCRKLTKVFVMSEYWRKSYIDNYGIAPEKVVNIRTGVNIQPPVNLVKDFSKKKIVFVGIDFKRKGGENLLRAFKGVRTWHPDATLDIVGPKTIPEMLTDDQFNKGVTFHGYLSREVPEEQNKLEQILRDGTLFILPSLYEPCGNAVLEAMLYKMPAIATNDWSFPDIITEATGRLFTDPNDSTELQNAIEWFLNRPEAAQTMGETARGMVLSRYTWNHVVNNITQQI